MTALQPRFNDSERSELRDTHRLTAIQVFHLERELGVIYDLLGPHAQVEKVRDELQSLSRELRPAAKRVKSWRLASQPSPGTVAIGLFQLAAANFQFPIPYPKA